MFLYRTAFKGGRGSFSANGLKSFVFTSLRSPSACTIRPASAANAQDPPQPQCCGGRGRNPAAIDAREVGSTP